MEIVGLITGVETSQRHTKWLIDDGSASIQCRLWEPATRMHNSIVIGRKALVRGKLDNSIYGERQIIVDQVLGLHYYDRRLYHLVF